MSPLQPLAKLTHDGEDFRIGQLFETYTIDARGFAAIRLDDVTAGFQAIVVGELSEIKAIWRPNRIAIPFGTTVDSLVDKLTDDNRVSTDPFSVIGGVIPAFFRVGYLAMDSPKEACRDAQEIVSICQQIASLACRPEVWTQASELIEAFSREGGNKIRLVDFANVCRENAILSYFVHAHDNDLQTAFTAHVVGLAHADQWYRQAGNPIYHELFVPYIVKFWDSAFHTRRFEFYVPRLIEGDLDRIQEEPVNLQAKQVLNAVRPSFNLNHAGECAEWLDR